MSKVRISLWLDAEVAATLRKRAATERKSVSRYLADLIAQDARRHMDELAAEGYRLLAGDTKRFAEAALPLAAEVWPEWVEDELDL